MCLENSKNYLYVNLSSKLTVGGGNMIGIWSRAPGLNLDASPKHWNQFDYSMKKNLLPVLPPAPPLLAIVEGASIVPITSGLWPSKQTEIKKPINGQLDYERIDWKQNSWDETVPIANTLLSEKNAQIIVQSFVLKFPLFASFPSLFYRVWLRSDEETNQRGAWTRKEQTKNKERRGCPQPLNHNRWGKWFNALPHRPQTNVCCATGIEAPCRNNEFWGCCR